LETGKRRLLTASLFLLQPLARLAGRLRNGLSPWRRRLRPRIASPRPKAVEVWSERWQEPQVRIQLLQDALAAHGAFVRSGGPFDRWDLQVRSGPLGGAKIRVAVEEHGSGRQLLRAKIWPLVSPGGLLVVAALVAVGLVAWDQSHPGLAVTFAVAALLLLVFEVEATGTAIDLASAEAARLAGTFEEKPVRPLPLDRERESQPLPVRPARLRRTVAARVRKEELLP